MGISSVDWFTNPKDEAKPDVKPKPANPPKEEPKKKKDDEEKENARKCQQAINLVNEQITRVKGRYCEMLIDKHKLRQRYKSIRNPHPKGYGSWDGHIQKYDEWKKDLRNIVLQANLIKNCKAPKEADDWLARRAPDNPNKELAKVHNCPES